MNEREALKLALEALEKVTKQMLALKDELAERGARPTTDVYHQKLWDSAFEAYTEHALPAATAIKEALAKPEQEPVAKNEEGRITWLVDDWPQNCFLYAEPPKWTPVEIGVDVTSEGAHVVAMYLLPDAVRYVFYSQFHTAPQRTWVGLTDEDFERIKLLTFEKEINAEGEEQEAVNLDQLIRAAEQLCKEKNRG